MNYPYQNEKRKFPKWIIWSLSIICILVLIIMVYCVYLYNHIQRNKTAGITETQRIIKKETDIQGITGISIFNERKQYHVVEGKTKNGEKEIVFVPKHTKSRAITIIPKSKVVSKNVMYQKWLQGCHGCKLMKITPAISDKQQPLWEITYRDQSNRYNIDYFKMYDGNSYEKLRFNSIFE